MTRVIVQIKNLLTRKRRRVRPSEAWREALCERIDKLIFDAITGEVKTTKLTQK